MSRYNPDPWPPQDQERAHKIARYMAEEQRVRHTRVTAQVTDGRIRYHLERNRGNAIDYCESGSPHIGRTVEIVAGFWCPIREARPFAPAEIGDWG